MDTKEKIIAAGKDAEKLSNNPIFVEAIEAIKNDILNNFMASNTNDKDTRESLYFQLRGIELLQTKLNAFSNNGKFEQNKLDNQRK